MNRWRRFGREVGWWRIMVLAWWPLLTCSYLWNPQPIGLLAEVLTAGMIVFWLRERHQQRRSKR
jgi:hypothetical protein